MIKTPPFINRDISWLSFNERVLQEAADPTVPLIDRLRFLGIFSSNMDEFYRVRVAVVKRLSGFGQKAHESLHIKPKKLLTEIQEIVLKQTKSFELIYDNIHEELKKHRIFIIDETQLTKIQGNFITNYFNEKVRPALVPIMLNQVKTFPNLKDKVTYLAIKLSVANRPRTSEYAIIEIPTDVLDRFILIPSKDGEQHIILLDDIIRFCLPEIFSIFKFNSFEGYVFKLTRDAELDMDNDLSQGIIDKISKSVKMRQKGVPVRFVYDEKIPLDLLKFITTKMKLNKVENLIPGGRYHNFKDFMKFPEVGEKDLQYERIKPIQHPLLNPDVSIFSVLKKTDVLLHYPYHNFSHFIDLLREAAIDPYVREIKITLYRAAKKSMVINALLNAAQNGKQVTVLVELQARFDEEANIKWAKTLQDEGVKVIYGVPGLKVHSKICLITRQESSRLKSYVNISTGNYNELTSTIYCDESLLTSGKLITQEVEHLFDFFERPYKSYSFKNLVLSPNHTRKKFLELIQQEIENAKAGKRSGIFLKMNSITDEELINKLYEASGHGVKIKLIVRGICSLIPGLPEISENIEAISIVDKFLEHSRIYLFENGGKEICYISSSDWMTRNLDHRIEVSCPIFDKKLRTEIIDILNLQWNDTTKARMIDATQSNLIRHHQTNRKSKSQVEIYTYLKQNNKHN